MEVIFLMQAYNSIDKGDSMFNSLVAEFIKNGHVVTVVAANENKGNTVLLTEGGANVLRVRTMRLFNVYPMVKGIANILLPLQYKHAMKKHLGVRNFDLIITPTPPITLTYLAKRCKQNYNANLFLILRDIFPQNAVDLKLINKHGLIYRFFRMVERDLYRAADAIGCMTQGNIDYLIKNNPEIDICKLHLLANWTLPSEGSPQGNGHIFNNIGLSDKFIVIFGGKSWYCSKS